MILQGKFILPKEILRRTPQIASYILIFQGATSLHIMWEKRWFYHKILEALACSHYNDAYTLVRACVHANTHTETQREIERDLGGVISSQQLSKHSTTQSGFGSKKKAAW